ncbi:uncharacterized membrane protein YcaP (DUF421 family) [Melghirimyces profundicolus]|uniref:Uncharacterized membrane protein YcaP (DUF421 family) n=1 Tax=Melghirimyces profundicolus TaxID=1242148 RepID=A0A2T6BQD6_9BACL|nr:DUF421 domain-containing protein [Melghirimyces profundicolus]PTX58313.1 uncharacterized membrane protein YcaP (DUF421 family) [Melghirimyces profundicolus]
MWYILKVAALFTSAIIALRLMGKSVMAQVTPHDLMAIVVIAALVTNPMLVEDTYQTLLAIALVTGLHILFAKLTLYRRANTWILGEPTILVKHGKMIRENLARCDISVAELLSTIRSKGFPDIRFVQYAILEPTGDVSVLPKDDLYPVTPRDLKLSVPCTGVSLALVVDGQIQKKNLQRIGKDEDWLKDRLKEQGYTDLKKILYASKPESEDRFYVDSGDG